MFPFIPLGLLTGPRCWGYSGRQIGATTHIVLELMDWL